jgi:hypothetical protein
VSLTACACQPVGTANATPAVLLLLAAAAAALAVFTSQIRGDSGTVGTVPVSKHCSNFYFFSVKKYSKID